MSEVEESDENEPIYSVQAQQVADDPAIDTDTALRQLMVLQIEVLENMMIAIWDVADALQLRTGVPNRTPKHDA